MKAQIFFFHGENSKYEKITDYKHKEEIPIDDIFRVAAFIFGKGLNVMLLHGEETTTIMVDDKNFRQR